MSVTKSESRSELRFATSLWRARALSLSLSVRSAPEVFASAATFQADAALSDPECTASLIMAEECPATPAPSLRAVNACSESRFARRAFVRSFASRTGTTQDRALSRSCALLAGPTPARATFTPAPIHVTRSAMRA